MSTAGTFRGTPNKTIGRGKMPDFDYNNSPAGSHIPRPKSESIVGQSEVGSAATSASRQRQNQSKRDEVCSIFAFKWSCSFAPGLYATINIYLNSMLIVNTVGYTQENGGGP